MSKSDAIVKVVDVSWCAGMGKTPLAEMMTNVINNLDGAGLRCVGVERVTEWHWLMLFAVKAETNA